MPQIISSGILMFHIGEKLEVFLTHPGGPYFKNNDMWFIPKGEVNPGEDLLEAAKREFHEETGMIAEGPFYDLGSVRLKSGKLVYIWAIQSDTKPAFISSNEFELEWPPRSGKLKKFPENDGGAFFPIELAKSKIHQGQKDFLSRLENLVKNFSGKHPQKNYRTT